MKNMSIYKTIFNDQRQCVLVKEDGEYQIDTVNNPADIAEAMNKMFNLQNQTDEYFYCICANTRLRPTAVFEIAHGGENACYVDTKKVFQSTLLCNASRIILVHNHPAGIPTPSAEDLAVTKRIEEGCELIGLKLLDHIIVGDHCYRSLANDGIVGGGK